MTTILFVRHGESQANAFLQANPDHPDLERKMSAIPDTELTEKGHTQAQHVGEYLAKCFGEKPVRVLTSLYTRTIQTSNPFQKLATKLTCVEHLGMLCEYTNPKHTLSQENIDRGITIHTSWDNFLQHVAEFVDLVEDRAQQSDIPIVVFGHSLFVSVLMSYIGSQKTFLPQKNELVFRFPNCSISSFEYSEGNWKILNVASIAHLPANCVTGTECDFATRFEK